MFPIVRSFGKYLQDGLSTPSKKIDLKLTKRTSLLLKDLGDFALESLSSIVRLVHSHEEFGYVLFIIHNSKRSEKIFLNLCEGLMSRVTNRADVQLAGFLVPASELDSNIISDLS